MNVERSYTITADEKRESRVVLEVGKFEVTILGPSFRESNRLAHAVAEYVVTGDAATKAIKRAAHIGSRLTEIDGLLRDVERKAHELAADALEVTP